MFCRAVLCVVLVNVLCVLCRISVLFARNYSCSDIVDAYVCFMFCVNDRCGNR